MTIKVVRPRLVATEDFRSAVRWYRREAGVDVAQRFVASVAETFAAIAEMPAIGSASWGDYLGIAGLRTRRIQGFPYDVFYFESEEIIDVWRILHQHRDISRAIVEDN